MAENPEEGGSKRTVEKLRSNVKMIEKLCTDVQNELIATEKKILTVLNYVQQFTKNLNFINTGDDALIQEPISEFKRHLTIDKDAILALLMKNKGQWRVKLDKQLKISE